MTISTKGPQRLYLMQVATITVGPFTIPVPCYFIQTRDGKNILIDSGFPQKAHFTANRPVGPTDADGPAAIASTHKLLELVERKHVSLVVFGHDSSQWATLKQLPDFFD